MSRITDAILGQKGFGVGSTAEMLDLSYGGQHGWSPNLNQWISNQAYVRRNLSCLVLEVPRFFSLMPNSDKWTMALKTLMEEHSRTIEGLNGGITLEFDEHPVGGAGEMHQEVTDAKRARSEPVHGFVEKYGKPIKTLLGFWMEYGIMSPETKFALISTLTGQKPDDMLADWFTMSCLYFEPDAMHRKVQEAWVVTNMMPMNNGDVTGKRDLTAASEVNNMSIPFTGIAQHNQGTKIFAQRILDGINLKNANPYLRPSFIQNIHSDVEAANVGYKKGIEDLGQSAVPGIR